MYISEQTLFEVFCHNIKKIVRNIKDQIVQDLNDNQVISRVSGKRRYSMDDDFILPLQQEDNYQQEFQQNALQFLNDSKYE